MHPVAQIAVITWGLSLVSLAVPPLRRWLLAAMPDPHERDEAAAELSRLALDANPVPRG